MVNFLIFPRIDDTHGFPSEVNRAIASSPEVSEVTALLINNPSNPIRQRLDTLYDDTTFLDGGSP
jgi:hypothetical protein